MHARRWHRGGMRISPKTRAFLGGMLLGNCVPHLATGLTGRRHMIPLRRNAPPVVNLLWAAANIAGGAVLIGRDRPEWDSRLVAVNGGAVAFATWMFTTEWKWPVNHART